MDRLTSNKIISEMSMYELAHNSCYAKDGKARYRDFEEDFDAREMTIKLLEKYAGIPNEFTCDEDFDDFIADALQYGMDSILGLIAVFYQNLWAMADLRERLKKYEDLEEQGKLLKPLCAVGDTVYTLNHLPSGKIVIGETVTDAFMCALSMLEGRFGKTIFLTMEEAKATLVELKKHTNCD